MDASLPLAGKTIVVTRPKHQSESISLRLGSLGARVVSFPLIAIEPPTDRLRHKEQLSHLDRYQYLIFTSRNSVEMTFSAMTKMSLTGMIDSLFATQQIAAVGKQTAKSLEKYGVKVSIVPDELFNSEAVLEHDALQNVTSQNIAIIRGQSGRDLLRNTLVSRGAEVDYIDVYRRVCPVSNLLPLVKCQEQSGIDIIALTSVEGLMNLFKLGFEQAWLKNTTLLVGSQRIANALKELDHLGKVIVADDPSDDRIIHSLMSWADNR